MRLERRVVGDAGPAVGHHRELVVRLGVPADRGVDGALERVGVALHQRVVDLVDVAAAEGVLEHRVGVLGLADHHHARRADVEPLHDPLPLRGAAGRDPEAGRGQVPDDGGAGPARVTGARRRRPACRSPRSTSSSWMIWMPSTTSGTTSSGSASTGRVTSSVAPASTRSLLAVAGAVDVHQAARDQVGGAGAREAEHLGQRGVHPLAGQPVRHREGAVVCARAVSSHESEGVVGTALRPAIRRAGCRGRPAPGSARPRR